MKVTMKVSMSGSRDGEDWPARGKLLECSATEADELCASGIAERAEAKKETATTKAPEKAVKS